MISAMVLVAGLVGLDAPVATTASYQSFGQVCVLKDTSHALQVHDGPDFLLIDVSVDGQAVGVAYLGNFPDISTEDETRAKAGDTPWIMKLSGKQTGDYLGIGPKGTGLFVHLMPASAQTADALLASVYFCDAKGQRVATRLEK